MNITLSQPAKTLIFHLKHFLYPLTMRTVVKTEGCPLVVVSTYNENISLSYCSQSRSGRGSQPTLRLQRSVAWNITVNRLAVNRLFASNHASLMVRQSRCCMTWLVEISRCGLGVE